MAQTLKPDLCVIGAGSGGLSVAAAAAQFGVEVVLLEKHKMGGDCLNYGCVPSKALIAVGKRAHAMRSSEPFGIRPVSPDIDPQQVHDRVKSVIAAIEPNDSVERFTGLGVHVIEEAGSFKDRNTVVAGDYEIKARRTILATGSSPALPPVPGIDNVPLFTNETIFDNQEKIDHLIIIGGGPIGMEMAQAHRRLGARVTVLEAFTALSKDDPELTAIVLKQLREEGIEIIENVRIDQLSKIDGGIRADLSKDEENYFVEGSHLLVAAGRKPNLSGLNLEAAQIEYNPRGIKVNSGLKTTNKKVYAIGDIAGGLQFTHVANYHAGIVIRNALFRMPVKMSTSGIPWVTYTEPEMAHVGLDETSAKAKNSNIKVLRWPYAENDRAQAEGATEGFVKVVTDKRGRILGASIVGEHAGEIIQMWALAISKKMKISAMTGFISPYPTLTEINKRVAYTYFESSLTSPLLRNTIKFLSKFG
ncbi:MAG: dihydrolipoyl dehydrogenase family protein [Methyloligellaceae bacterium]